MHPAQGQGQGRGGPAPSKTAAAPSPTPPPTTRTVTLAELSRCDGRDGRAAWIAVDGYVLDVTKFASGHPGGETALLAHAGTDATDAFFALHRRDVLEHRLERLCVGRLASAGPAPAPHRDWLEISRVPYAEIDMDSGSPYWNESHKRLRSAVRRFLWESGTVAWAERAEASGEYPPPRELLQMHGRAGLLLSLIHI